MKSCPTCNRTYSDDGFTFCLNDGALLSAPYDPHATLILPSRRTERSPAGENRPTSPPDTPELPATTVPALPLLERMADRSEKPETTEVEGISRATIVTIVLLIFGSLILAVFLSRCS